MTELRKTFFISDLHLDESHPEITQKFLQFMQHLDASVDAVYILGDLFEAWIGDDDNSAFHDDIIKTLHAVTQKNIPIYYLHGNRDFLIGKRFLQATGCVLLQDETRISLYGSPVLLMHGDTLCTKDVAYLKARNKMRHPLLQTLFLLLPLGLRRKIAQSLRAKSRQYTTAMAAEVMDVTADAVESVMQKNAVHALIHGHTHKPDIHHLVVGGMPALRIVLGAWHEKGNKLVWDEMGNKALVDF